MLRFNSDGRRGQAHYNLGLSVSFLSPRVDECVQLLNWCKVNTKIQDSLTAKALSAVGQMTLNASYESGDNKRRTCRNALNSNGRKRAGEVMKCCSGKLSSTYCSINRMAVKEVLLHSNAPGKHQPAFGQCGPQQPERVPQHLLQPRSCLLHCEGSRTEAAQAPRAGQPCWTHLKEGQRSRM